MKTIIVSLIIVLTIFTFVTPSHALWWMVYHKPAFKGKVIDAETKEPIEGAVVVVIYEKYPIISGPGGGSASIINIKEFLTDKNGEFCAPSYTTIIQPFSVEADANFIIYKPGYGKFPHGQVYPPKDFWGVDSNKDMLFEEYFSKETGAVKEAFFKEPWNPRAEMRKGHIAFGIVELPKLKAREERLDSLPSIPGPDIPSKKMQNLIRLFNEEAVSLGLEPISLP